jgi:hypothetical protein
MSIEAMKQALDALTYIHAETSQEEDIVIDAAITALRTAIEQAEKPVAWQVMVEDEAMNEFPIKDMAHDWCVKQKLFGSPYSYWIRPLYTTPTAAPVQEPVAWTSLTEIDWARREPGRAGSFWAIPNDPAKEIALYAAPRQWVGLTDEEIKEIIGPWGDTPIKWRKRELFDQIEAKLKEKNAA